MLLSVVLHVVCFHAGFCEALNNILKSQQKTMGEVRVVQCGFLESLFHLRGSKEVNHLVKELEDCWCCIGSQGICEVCDGAFKIDNGGEDVLNGFFMAQKEN